MLYYSQYCIVYRYRQEAFPVILKSNTYGDQVSVFTELYFQEQRLMEKQNFIITTIDKTTKEYVTLKIL